MPRSRFYRLLLSTLALLYLPPVTAVEDDWYQIEIVVFSRQPAATDNPEYWPADPGRPNTERVRLLHGAGSDTAAFSRLDASELQLDGAYWSLRSASALKPLLHLAWRQPLTGTAEPVYLASADGGREGPELEGTISVSVNRYLHADLDLLLHRSTPAGPTKPEPAEPTQTPIDPYTAPPVPAPATEGYVYRMQAHRRMRGGELHYIDHPLLGVLLQIDRYREAKEQPPAAEPAPAVEQAPAPAAPAQPNG